MKSPIVPFWTWNKRKSQMSLSPKRKPSGKLPIKVRALRNLVGIRFGRAGMKELLAARRIQILDAKMAKGFKK